MKTYSKYKDSGIDWIGRIPEDWEISKLKHKIHKISDGATPSRSDEENFGQDYFWVVVKDISENIYSTSEMISEKGFKNSSVKLWQPEDIVISLGATIGEVGVAKIPLTTKQGVSGISVNHKKIFSKYLYYLLKSNKLVFRAFSTGTTISEFRPTKLAELFFQFPPLQEQKAIASFLDEKTSKINKLVEQKKKLIELLKEQRVALINEAVTKGLDPNVEMKDSGVEWIGMIPKHWNAKKLKYVSQLLFSNVDKKFHEREIPVKSCNYVDVYKNDFIDSRISFLDIGATENEIEKFSIKKGDVLVTKDSETPQDIAVPSLVLETIENVLCGYHLAIIRENDELKGSYVFRILQSKNYNVHFEISARGVTRYGLSMDTFKQAIVPLPPVHEQEGISTFLNQETSKIDKSIEKIQKEIDLLQEYKEALISEAVTGKIKVF